MEIDVSVYRGYANEREIVIFGHVFKKNAPSRFVIDQKRKWKHAYAILQMFRVKTLEEAKVEITFKNIKQRTTSLKDGYFRCVIPYSEKLESGWHQFGVKVDFEGKQIKEQGELIKPFPGEYGFISDIDDTFLISHSKSLFKKLYVMLSRNVARRKTFEGVVKHYNLLNKAGREQNDGSNAFFYVSSSEWNLYHFIKQFTILQELPKAVFKLKEIKSGLKDLLFSGRGDHNHKFQKIKHLMEFYPELKFVLLGDDSQQDPFIYEQISKIFPSNLKAVYIRQTNAKKFKTEVASALKNIEKLDVETCYFIDSEVAIAHSKKIGII